MLNLILIFFWFFILKLNQLWYPYVLESERRNKSYSNSLILTTQSKLPDSKLESNIISFCYILGFIPTKN